MTKKSIKKKGNYLYVRFNKKDAGEKRQSRQRIGSDLNMDIILNDDKWDTDIEEERKSNIISQIVLNIVIKSFKKNTQK